MPGKMPAIVNIALVGGGDLCRDFLTKSTLDYQHKMDARVLAVADQDANAPGIVLAKKLTIVKNI